MQLVEEVGEVAEVLNSRSGRKEGVQDSNEELAKELADVIHYTVASAAINRINLTKTIFEKDKTAAIKYQHERDLEGFLKGTSKTIRNDFLLIKKVLVNIRKIKQGKWWIMLSK